MREGRYLGVCDSLCDGLPTSRIEASLSFVTYYCLFFTSHLPKGKCRVRPPTHDIWISPIVSFNSPTCGRTQVRRLRIEAAYCLARPFRPPTKRSSVARKRSWNASEWTPVRSRRPFSSTGCESLDREEEERCRNSRTLLPPDTITTVSTQHTITPPHSTPSQRERRCGGRRATGY